MATMNSASDLLASSPRPDPAWFLRANGVDASTTIHGVDHVRRVAAHASELARALGVPAQEREAVLCAALWHDIGRESDGADCFHGARSAGKVIGLGLHLGRDPRTVELALFAVTFHVPDDAQGERAARKLTSPLAGLRVLRLLKDADALDRVRFGPHNLDSRLLRLPESHGRLDRARALLEATTAVPRQEDTP